MVLGHMLFLFYTTYLSSVSRFSILQCFADGTQVVHDFDVDESMQA